MRKLIGIAFILALFVSGCGKDANQIVKTDNSNVQLELLFEHDGCKVYRFMDFGEPVYYADCRAAGSVQTSTKWGHIVGKVEKNFQSTTIQKDNDGGN